MLKLCLVRKPFLLGFTVSILNAMSGFLLLKKSLLHLLNAALHVAQFLGINVFLGLGCAEQQGRAKKEQKGLMPEVALELTENWPCSWLSIATRPAI